MASFNTLESGRGRTSIPSFRGLMQYGDGINADPRYATDCRNMETPGGVMQPAAACALMPPALAAPIETLARLHRRWYTGVESKDILVAGSGGKLYAMLPSASAWTELAMPEGVASYQSNEWSWVTYEINPEGSEASVDVLLLSNAKDGMVMVRGDTMGVSVVNTPKKFGVIERYAERIWGGAIEDDPDMLVYSAPYDPTNWEANVSIPEDGAGDISQPSWDGDSFTALRAFGSQLIAFKKTRIWRILGTDPGEYTFKEQYGGGAPYAATIAVDSERIFMLGGRGVMLYDGLTAEPFQTEYAEGVFRRMNAPVLHKASACLWRGKYYCALPLDGSAINNAVLIYDTADGTWLLRDDVSVEAFLPTDDELFFTSSTTPGCIWHWQEDSWQTGAATKSACAWTSPWNDLGRKDYAKGSFEVYLQVEVKDAPVTLSVTLQTEKKSKVKTMTVSPITESGKGFKLKCLRFGGTGRRYRLTISVPAGSSCWRLVGGVTILAETDPD